MSELLLNKEITLFAEDETIIYRNTTITRMWTEKGKRSEVLSDFSHQKICLFGAVDIQSGSLYYKDAGIFNSKTFEEFLRMFLNSVDSKRRIVMILDNVKWHKSEEIKLFLSNVKDRLEFLYLPKNSPDLNPIERVWKFIRRSITHNTYFETLEKLQVILFNFLKKFNKPNDILKSLCAVI